MSENTLPCKSCNEVYFDRDLNNEGICNKCNKIEIIKIFKSGDKVRIKEGYKSDNLEFDKELQRLKGKVLTIRPNISEYYYKVEEEPISLKEEMTYSHIINDGVSYD